VRGRRCPGPVLSDAETSGTHGGPGPGTAPRRRGRGRALPVARDAGAAPVSCARRTGAVRADGGGQGPGGGTGGRRARRIGPASRTPPRSPAGRHHRGDAGQPGRPRPGPCPLPGAREPGLRAPSRPADGSVRPVGTHPPRAEAAEQAGSRPSNRPARPHPQAPPPARPPWALSVPRGTEVGAAPRSPPDESGTTGDGCTPGRDRRTPGTTRRTEPRPHRRRHGTADRPEAPPALSVPRGTEVAAVPRPPPDESRTTGDGCTPGRDRRTPGTTRRTEPSRPPLTPVTPSPDHRRHPPPRPHHRGHPPARPPPARSDSTPGNVSPEAPRPTAG
jgi:hypothetical protein